MDDYTVDQLYALFGDLKTVQESQARTLSKIESLVSERFSGLSNNIASLGASIDKLASSTGTVIKQTGSAIDQQNTTANTIAAGQEEQISATKKLDKSLTQGFKSISSAFLSREGKQAENKKDQRISNLLNQEETTKQLKLTRKEIVSLNTKMGILIKDVKDSNKSEKTTSILSKFLGPVVLLLGGIAALYYGATRLPKIKAFLSDLTKGGIGQSIGNLINKIKPQDKSITEWLRGMPLVGRFFDIYDAFQAFAKGDYKQGMKHLAFAIPGGEFLVEMLGGVTKQQFLKPGGGKAFVQGFSIEKIYERIVGKIKGVFEPISNFFGKIKEIVTPMLQGTWSGISTGLSALSEYFPILAPVAQFLDGMTDDLFASALAGSARAAKPDAFGPINLVDIAKEAIHKVIDGVTGFFEKIAKIFGYIGQFVSAIGQVFSGDYRQQVAGISTIEQFSPGIGNVLRTALNVVDTFKQYNITSEDSLWDVIKKVAFTKSKFSDKFSKQNTFAEEQAQLTQQINTLPEDDPERAKLEQRKKLEAISMRREQLNTQRKEEEAKIAEETLPKYSEEYKKLRTKQVAEAAYQMGNEILGPVGGFFAEQIGSIFGKVQAAGEGAIDYLTESAGLKSREEELRQARERKQDLDLEYEEKMSELSEAERKARGVTAQPLSFNRSMEDIRATTPSPLPPNSILEPTAPPIFRDINGTASRNQQFSDLSKTLSDSSEKMNTKLNFLQEIYLETKRQNELLADIRSSNINMERQPTSSVTLNQGSTNLNFGSKESSSGLNRGAFSPQAFALS
jgi:hypothetical protein